MQRRGQRSVWGTAAPLARHDSSWRVYKRNRQVTHPHPSFTPDNRAVLYTSDVDFRRFKFLKVVDPFKHPAHKP